MARRGRSGTVNDLARLSSEAPGMRIEWAIRRPSLQRVLGGGENDQLKERGRLGMTVGKTAMGGKELIAIAVAATTQCPYCIRGHTKAAMRHGATPEEVMEAIWVAAEMRAGGAYAHSALALDVIAFIPDDTGVVVVNEAGSSGNDGSAK